MLFIKQEENPLPHVKCPGLNGAKFKILYPQNPGQAFLIRPSGRPMLHTPASGRSQGLTRWVRRACEGCQEEASSQPTAVALLLLQILRTLKGYDSYSTLLLPPRIPGDKLPPELYEYFKEMKRSKEEQMKAKYLESLVQENGESSVPRTRLQPPSWRPRGVRPTGPARPVLGASQILFLTLPEWACHPCCMEVETGVRSLCRV